MTREEARNELVLWRNCNSDNGYHKKFVDALTVAIKALGQEPRWIPVSERLPKREISEQLRGWYLTTNAYGSVGVTKYEFENGSWGSAIRIVAWMPLPKPYKEESEE